MSVLSITHFTDPGCPWAFSAEPQRLRLLWRFGDAITWRLRMVGLAESPEEYEAKGLTAEKLAEGAKRIASAHGMPIDPAGHSRLHGTVAACRAVVAARVHAPEHEEALLRRLRVRTMGGELLDETATLHGAATDVGIPTRDLDKWLVDDDVEDLLREDLELARMPTLGALAQDDKLADAPHGRRYTCPSYEFVREANGEQLSVPGFQPASAYDIATGNLAPEVEPEDPADDVADVLEWAGMPLASQEVAVICGLDRADARARLARVAVEEPVGYDGYWTLK